MLDINDLYRKIGNLKSLIDSIHEIVDMYDSEMADSIKELISEYEGEEEC